MPTLRLHTPKSRSKSVAILLALLAVAGFLVANSSRASSYSPVIPFPTACGTCRMNANEALTDTGWVLKMQGDGNLVMRKPSGTACFASNTAGNTNAHVTYQGDGNFVVYSSGGSALWNSGTAGKWIGSGYNVSVHNGFFYVGQSLIHGPC